jgi:uncharacterized protein YoxC
MDLSSVIQIGAVIGIIAFIVLIIYLVVLIRSVNNLVKFTNDSVEKISNTVDYTMKNISRDISELKTQMVDSLGIMNDTMTNASNAIDSVKKEVHRFGGIIEPFEALSSYVYSKVEPPVLRTVGVLSGLFKGVTSFANVITKFVKDRE